MNLLLQNWKTTSAGLALIINGLVHICFAIKAGALSEHDLQDTLLSVAGGLGLIFARDSTAAKVQVDDLKATLATHETAIKTGDTSMLGKPAEPPTKT